MPHRHSKYNFNLCGQQKADLGQVKIFSYSYRVSQVVVCQWFPPHFPEDVSIFISKPIHSADNLPKRKKSFLAFADYASSLFVSIDWLIRIAWSQTQWIFISRDTHVHRNKFISVHLSDIHSYLYLQGRYTCLDLQECLYFCVHACHHSLA